MRLSQAKRRFAKEWLVFSFTDETKEEGRVLLHHKDRHELHRKLTLRKIKRPNLYITFAGPQLPKDAAIVFLIR